MPRRHYHIHVHDEPGSQYGPGQNPASHHATLAQHGWVKRMGQMGAYGHKDHPHDFISAGGKNWTHFRAQHGPGGQYNGMHSQVAGGKDPKSLHQYLASGGANVGHRLSTAQAGVHHDLVKAGFRHTGEEARGGSRNPSHQIYQHPSKGPMTISPKGEYS